jgi:anthranilate/para-aminobenzoate synthase component I
MQVEQQPRLRFDGDETTPGWTVAPFAPRRLILADAAGRCRALETGKSLASTDDPLQALGWIEQTLRDPRCPADASWSGFIGYELGKWLETLPARAIVDPAVPLLAMGLHFRGMKPSSIPLPPHLSGRLPLKPAVSRAYFEASVARALDYITAGDIFQVNLSQQLVAGLSCDPSAIYSQLLAHTPSAYGALIELGDFSIISNSPELFFRVEVNKRGERTIINRPIKGTRPKLPGMREQLVRSEKDIAELAMIVDLQRNDLGRVCEIGSVKVTVPRVIEETATVYHGVAEVRGTLRRDVGLVDILRGVFPCGSITGCPKIRAMQIIDELEPVARGPYCGAIGHIRRDGSMEFSVAIRTMYAVGGKIHIPVGAGIVADSTPAGEYEETMVKSRAMVEALNRGIGLRSAT